MSLERTDIERLRALAAEIAAEAARNYRRYRFAAWFFILMLLTQGVGTFLLFHFTRSWSSFLGVLAAIMALFMHAQARQRVRQWRRLMFHAQRIVARDPALAWHWESLRLVLDELKR